MYQIDIRKKALRFKFPAGTSRGVLTEKPSWFLLVKDTENPDRVGIGECSLIPGLSPDSRPDFEAGLYGLVHKLNQGLPFTEGAEWPSVGFGWETALLDLRSGGRKVLYDGKFASGQSGIPINGLIWMGEKEFMFKQIREKLEAGWRCLKLKIGALDFDTELGLIRFIRSQFRADELTIRTDANGAFPPEDALEKLTRLAEFSIHSIEQPIRQGQIENMARLCSMSPIPIALDEELIGLYDSERRRTLIKTIKPDFLILKPSLIGGLASAEEWIRLAKEYGIGYWVTSALESNIGLNALAQWTYSLNPEIPQGLGTGQLFENNWPGPLVTEPGILRYDPAIAWDVNELLNG